MFRSTLLIFAGPNGGCEDDGNNEDKRQWSDIDHVSGDNAEVENFGIDAAHAIQSGLVIVILSRAWREFARLRIDLMYLPAAGAVEYAMLLTVFFANGRGV